MVSVAQDLRNALEPLLLKYQVDLSWHGHDHGEALWPVAEL